MADYRVNLDIYDGPLDLLLYLIRREEVDIHDIPIARITEQYVRHVDMLKALDPNVAGEFLVMAASLMEIKARMLLPAPEMPEGAEGIQIDPRAELVRQLMEYKSFKDAAVDLTEMAREQALRFPRGRVRPDGPEEAELDLEDVQVWHLFDAFSRIMESIGSRPTHHEVIYDDTPVELHATDIMDRLRRDGGMSFERIFEGRTLRSEIVGLFLALLELVRLKKIFATQERNFGEIHVHVNPNPPTPEELDAQERELEQRHKRRAEQHAREKRAAERRARAEFAAEMAAANGSPEDLNPGQVADEDEPDNPPDGHEGPDDNPAPPETAPDAEEEEE